MRFRLTCLTVVVLCLVLTEAGFADDLRLVLDRLHSQMTFSGQLDSMNAGGAFTDFNGAILPGEEGAAPASISFSVTMATASFTEGNPREKMFLQAIAATLQNSTAKYSSSKVTNTAGRNFIAHGSMSAFGKSYDMNVPFTVVEASSDSMRLRGVLKDKGKVLPFEVPGVSGEFVGGLKFDLLFVKGR